MNLIRNLNRLLKFRRCFQTSVNTTQKLVLEPLMDREVIRLKGDEVVPFLQGLITNDIKHLYASSNRAIYAMFLNKAGRVMYDTILYSTSEPTEILMECDRNVANDIQRHLKLYRVRRKIDIDSLKQEIKVWQAFEPNTKPYNITDRMDKGAVCDILAATTDPRLGQLGARLLANSDKTFEELSELFKQQTINVCNENNFRLHRYSLGIAEGVSDLPPGKCFPLEVNCDILNGVSFHKGCYIGQELTARVHHTGVIRKRLMPVRLTNPLPSDDVAKVENEIGANCGTIYGSIANSALGLLRVEKVCKAKELLINGKPCFTEIPQWWPQELQPNTFTKIPKDI